MDRRKFLAVSAAGIAAAAVNPQLALAEAGALGRPRRKQEEGGDYSVVILGDTHFDTEPDSIYHSCYNEPVEWLNRVQRAEFARNGQMWRERCPRMMRRAAELVGPDTRMIFQMGDLIQGDCGNPDVHKKMLEDVISSFKSTLGGLPFVTVVGNHDIRGTEAEQAYREYMPARMSEELGKKVTGTTFSFTIGPDVFIVIDFNSPDVDEIFRLLKDSEGARHTFVITHGPVFPYDAPSGRWFLLGERKNTAKRRQLRAELARRCAIVLCGHTHRVELADWFGDGGRITQMTMNSVWEDEALGTLAVDAGGAKMYGELRKGFRNDDGTPIKDETPLYEEYRPGLKRYVHALGAGSFRMNVSRHGIVVDFYGGDSREITESFVLR